jgi:hypothetical protein
VGYIEGIRGGKGSSFICALAERKTVKEIRKSIIEG